MLYPYQEKKYKDGVYYRIGNGDLIICLVYNLTQPFFDEIIADKQEKIIVLDRAFANNDQVRLLRRFGGLRGKSEISLL